MHQLDRDPRHTCARADVRQRSDVGRKDPEKQETVEEEVVDDPPGVVGSYEALRFLPLLEEFQVFAEGLELAVAQRPAEDDGATGRQSVEWVRRATPARCGAWGDP